MHPTLPRHAVVLALLLAPAIAGAQGAERFPLAGRDVAVYNLAGTMTVEGTTGSGVVVEVTRVGGDAARLRIDTDDVAGRSEPRSAHQGDSRRRAALRCEVQNEKRPSR